MYLPYRNAYAATRVEQRHLPPSPATSFGIRSNNAMSGVVNSI